MDKKWSIYLVLVCLVLSVVAAPVNATTNANVIDEPTFIAISYNNEPAKLLLSNITISTNSNFKFAAYLLKLLWTNYGIVSKPLVGRNIRYDLLDSSGNIIKHNVKLTNYFTGRRAVFKIGKLPEGNYTLNVYYKGNKGDRFAPCKKSYNLSVVG